MDAEQVARMASLAGEGQGKAFKYNVPMIKFNGVSGEYRQITWDEKNGKQEEPVKSPIRFTILKKRKLLSSFSPTASYFTHEYEGPNDRVALFKNVAGVITFEKEDTPANLRAEVQSLRTREVLYILHEGIVKKFELKGGSLTCFYDYLKSLSDDSKHTFTVDTVCGSEKHTNDAKFTYQRATFKAEALSVDPNTVEEKMKEVVENIRKVDESARAKRDKPSYSTAADKEFGELTGEETEVAVF